MLLLLLLLICEARLNDPVPPPMDEEETGVCPISPGDEREGKGPPYMREGGGGKMEEEGELSP